MKRTIIIFGFTLLITGICSGQQAPSIRSARDSAYFSNPYPYILPILGSKVHQVGVRLPFPFGVMVNSLVGTQYLTLDQMKLGFGNYTNPNPPDMIDLDDVVTFEEISAQTSTFNMRVDAWLLPFLNILPSESFTSAVENTQSAP